MIDKKSIINYFVYRIFPSPKYYLRDYEEGSSKVAAAHDFYKLFLDNAKKILYPEELINLDLNFSKSELLALLILEQHGEIIMSQIADYINIPLSTATGLVNRLVKNGYIERERNESDRRIVAIQLTDKGKVVTERVKGIALGYLGLIDQVLSDEESQVLYNVMEKVLHVLGQTVKEKKDETGIIREEAKNHLINIKID